MTVSCNPEPDPVQQGVVADVLPPTETVKMSAEGFDTSTPFVAAPTLWGGERGPQTKKSPSGDLSDSSELLPSFGWSSSSSSSSSPTLPWGTAEKTRRLRFRPTVCGRVNRRTVRARAVCLMCHHFRRLYCPIGKTECPSPVGCCYRRY